MLTRDALADAVLFLHAALVLFNLGGLLVVLLGHSKGWRLTHHRTLRLWHLGIVWFIAVETALGIACPLTLLEDILREGAESGGGFLQRWISRLLYWDLPPWVFVTGYLAFALAVTAAYILRPPTRVSSLA